MYNKANPLAYPVHSLTEHVMLSKILNSLRASDLTWLPPTVHSNCSEWLWLHARTLLVALENYFCCPSELFWLTRRVAVKQLRTCLTCASSTYAPPFSLLPMPPQKHKYNTVSAIADELW